MKITVLDGFTTNPGDLSWDWLTKCGDCTIYERTPADLIAERCNDCDIIITNKTPLRKEFLKTLPALKYIGLLSTGFNIVDWEYCKENGIPVCNIPSYSTSAVAQLVFALILEHTNAVALHSNSVHGGEWAASKDFCYWKTPLTELDGKTLGIIGFGKIGKAVAKIAAAFGMKILASTNHPAPFENVEFCSRDDLIERSDFISLHCPLTPATEGMVNAEFLSKMKKTAMLINTSRGPVVDEYALAEALENGIISAAGLDVLETEPPKPDCPLLGLKNCYITPHIAWAGFETRERLMKICRENVEAFLNGNPVNLVY
ncbi:MAG: D-2-hydroxyacid dehydrogenase [Ruminococcaceae bacterium]|nr:D-2-hydroxyacid dehydrogenase [Oscillospiraceae bacterium]